MIAAAALVVALSTPSPHPTPDCKGGRYDVRRRVCWATVTMESGSGYSCPAGVGMKNAICTPPPGWPTPKVETAQYSYSPPTPPPEPFPTCGPTERTLAHDGNASLCSPLNEPPPPCRTHEQAALALVQQSIAHGTAALAAKTKAQGDHEAALQRIDASAARLQQQAYAGCKK